MTLDEKLETLMPDYRRQLGEARQRGESVCIGDLYEIAQARAETPKILDQAAAADASASAHRAEAARLEVDCARLRDEIARKEKDVASSPVAAIAAKITVARAEIEAVTSERNTLARNVALLASFPGTNELLWALNPADAATRPGGFLDAFEAILEKVPTEPGSRGGLLDRLRTETNPLAKAALYRQNKVALRTEAGLESVTEDVA